MESSKGGRRRGWSLEAREGVESELEIDASVSISSTGSIFDLPRICCSVSTQKSSSHRKLLTPFFDAEPGSQQSELDFVLPPPPPVPPFTLSTTISNHRSPSSSIYSRLLIPVHVYTWNSFSHLAKCPPKGELSSISSSSPRHPPSLSQLFTHSPLPLLLCRRRIQDHVSAELRLVFLSATKITSCTCYRCVSRGKTNLAAGASTGAKLTPSLSHLLVFRTANQVSKQGGTGTTSWLGWSIAFRGSTVSARSSSASTPDHTESLSTSTGQQYHLAIFGSIAYGLDSDLTDLDICVVVSVSFFGRTRPGTAFLNQSPSRLPHRTHRLPKEDFPTSTQMGLLTTSETLLIAA